MRGRIREGRGWIEGILAETGRGVPAERARALNGAGNFARGLGDYARAAEYHAEALALRREIGDTLGVALSLNNLGAVAHDQGRYATAEAYFSDAIEAARQAGERQGLALSLNNLSATGGMVVRTPERGRALCPDAAPRVKVTPPPTAASRGRDGPGDGAVALERPRPVPVTAPFQVRWFGGRAGPTRRSTRVHPGGAIQGGRHDDAVRGL